MFIDVNFSSVHALYNPQKKKAGKSLVDRLRIWNWRVLYLYGGIFKAYPSQLL